jgi:hypothetical protein
MPEAVAILCDRRRPVQSATAPLGALIRDIRDIREIRVIRAIRVELYRLRHFA